MRVIVLGTNAFAGSPTSLMGKAISEGKFTVEVDAFSPLSAFEKVTGATFRLIDIVEINHVWFLSSKADQSVTGPLAAVERTL